MNHSTTIKTRFIANPFSGTNRKRKLGKLLAEHLDGKRFDYELCHTERAGHAIELAAEAVEKGYGLVVACGGDGSVNEVARPLIGTETKLGVIPCGSGNGFAMHIGMGRNVPKAIQMLNSAQPFTIDTCRMNGRPFVNLSGVGFDAVVSNRLHNSTLRGLKAYVRFTLEEVFGYEMQDFEIQVDGKIMHRKCLLAEVANAPIYGYGFSIVPPAKLNDGKLEILIAKAAPKWRYLLESWRFFNRSFHQSSLTECLSGREVAIRPNGPTAVHVDGEGMPLNGEAKYSILPASLKVMVPKGYAEILEK